MKASSSIYIGLMSGTSTDGIDGVLADFSNPARPVIMAEASIDMPASLRTALLSLNQSGPDELVRSSLAANALVAEYATACQQLLQKSGLQPSDVHAIGAHGQTVRHNPTAGFTCQLNSPALLAELTGINVIADFRTRDVAAGGQGAPLVPAFHSAVFSHDKPRTVLNLGGMANITVLTPNQPVTGFDTGPANVLLDLWCEKHTGKPFDENGRWASGGTVCNALLNYLVDSEPWFALPPPKSTGRDLFNPAWLEHRLGDWCAKNPETKLQPQDIQATLVELTARTVSDDIRSYAANSRDVVACGGGVKNATLMQALARLTGLPVLPADTFGVPARLVEALAFAWLAWAFENDYAAGLPTITGARQASVLGCLYKA